MHVFEQHRAVKASVACRFVLSFYLSRSYWPRTPGPATAFPNLILIPNQPPMVALWVPKAASESLEKKTSLFLFVSVILAPDTWSRHSFSQSNSGPKPAPMVALWVPNAASESLEKKVCFHLSRSSWPRTSPTSLPWSHFGCQTLPLNP